jgi:hypothetical protein
MKKLLGTLFLIFALISVVSFLFPEGFQEWLNMIFSGYSWAVMGAIWLITLILTVVFFIALLTDKKK